MLHQVNEAFVNDEDNNSDSGVSGGGNGGGTSSPEDSGSIGRSSDNLPLVAQQASRLHNSLNLAAHDSDPPQDQGISGHENPVYEDSSTEGAYGPSEFSSVTSDPPSLVAEEVPSRSVVDRVSSAAAGEREGESSPYEPMVVVPSGAMQLQHGREIGGRGKTEAEPQFRMNPLYKESQRI